MVRPSMSTATGLLSILAFSVLVAACGNGGGNFQQDNVQVNAADVTEPGVNELFIPELLEPSIVDGVATFDLSLEKSNHDFGSGEVVDTLAYNQQSILGPTLRWSSGAEIKIDVKNNLEDGTTAHWHGADVPADDDGGGPHSRIEPGQTWTADFAVIQPAATLWYHPHMMGTSAEQVFYGAAGMIIVDDGNPAAADLPQTYGIDDVPVILQDREFGEGGQLSFEIDNDDDGDLNPDLTVNGTSDPYTTVPAGLVRLRLLNASQARVYELSADNDSMIKIASDGGYLPVPVALQTLTLGPGDRAEVIVDTSNGSVKMLDANFGRVLELRPNSDLSAIEDLPEMLTTIDEIALDEIDRDRTFVMDEVGEGWGINGQQMDMDRVDETIKFNDTERWTITVADGVHTFHVHQTQFQILEINGEPPPPEDAGWEDTVLVSEDREVVLAARFDSYTNPDTPYMFHCHILDHEDLGMMGQFKVVE